MQKKDYQRAIRYLRKACSPDEAKPRLEKKFWLASVDCLGMSLGLSGDLKGAREVYEKALKQAPDYPNFYYCLACCHAEEGRLTETLENLRLALKYKANVLEGETLPDPARDSSFQKYLTQPEFRKLLEEWK
ncbi:MAG: tetratricopeptide repeat protein [Acidobacteria bacterium]|nr:tetratricopeptide repeat protein [Acidobacteriota bacterium]